MTVGALITKLATLDPDLIVLTDNEEDFMEELDVVSQGVAYKIEGGAWVSQEPWAHKITRTASAVYVGTGESVVMPVWDEI